MSSSIRNLSSECDQELKKNWHLLTLSLAIEEEGGRGRGRGEGEDIPETRQWSHTLHNIKITCLNKTHH